MHRGKKNPSRYSGWWEGANATGRSRSADDGVPVDGAGGGRDGGADDAQDRRAVPRDGVGDGAGLAVEVDEEVIGPDEGGAQLRGGVGADLDGDVGRSADDDVEVDGVEGNVGGGVRGRLPVRVAGGAAGAAGAGRVGAVRVDDLLRGDGEGGGVPVLVGVDVVGEEVAPAVVGHVGDVLFGAGGEGFGVKGADVVRFTKVVPGQDLRKSQLL